MKIYSFFQSHSKYIAFEKVADKIRNLYRFSNIQSELKLDNDSFFIISDVFCRDYFIL